MKKFIILFLTTYFTFCYAGDKYVVGIFEKEILDYEPILDMSQRNVDDETNKYVIALIKAQTIAKLPENTFAYSPKMPVKPYNGLARRLYNEDVEIIYESKNILMQPSINEDNQNILYVERVYMSGSTLDIETSINMINIKTKQRRKLISNGAINIMPVWNKAKGIFLFCSNIDGGYNIYQADTMGGGISCITSSILKDEDCDYFDPVYSSDYNKIMFVTYNNKRNKNVWLSKIVEHDLLTKETKVIAENKKYYYMTPSYIGDGKIVVTTYKDKNYRVEIIEKGKKSKIMDKNINNILKYWSAIKINGYNIYIVNTAENNVSDFFIIIRDNIYAIRIPPQVENLKYSLFATPRDPILFRRTWDVNKKTCISN